MSDVTWLESSRETVAGYRRMIDGTIAQLSDEAFFRRPAPGFNGVANLLRHLAGNLRSRWTNFLTEDGEKPDRDRDLEFADWTGTRAELLAEFDAGWNQLVETLEALTPEDAEKSVRIRGEALSVPFAIQRSLTHVAYHVGQLVLVARLVHEGDWNWLTIAPGASRTFNSETWGTSASRGAAGQSS